MSTAVLHPNVGGEEPGGPDVPAARAMAQLWRLAFGNAAGWPDDTPAAWPDTWGPFPSEPAFDWQREDGLWAWWNDAESCARADATSLPLIGADPAVVARVHDKGFAVACCERERLFPRPLRSRVHVFAPEAWDDVDRFAAALWEHIAEWPGAWRDTATLKPRIGTSGRGRVRIDTEGSWLGALPRLAARGGAVLEPWLPRRDDYSVQLHIARDGTLTLLGVLTLAVSEAGVYLGHRGELDHRGRVTTGTGVEDALLGAAMEVAQAAHGEGYWGPCSVDAFSFDHEGEVVLRPVVEFNARFTTGTVLLALLRRARAAYEAVVPAEPGTRRAFRFGTGLSAGSPAWRTDLGAGTPLEVDAARTDP
ncbi:MAG: hypothetical protein AAF430_01200 [Myxococcota bacterium]